MGTTWLAAGRGRGAWPDPRPYLDVYRAQMKITLAVQLEHRAHLVIWVLYEALLPVVQLVVWTAVAASSGRRLAGYTGGELAAYFLAVLVVDQLTSSWVVYEFEQRVRQGHLSPRLLRPIHPIHTDVASNLTAKLLKSVALVPTVAVLVLLFRPELELAPGRLPLLVPSVLLAAALRFVVGWTVALAAFWTTRAGAVNGLFFVAQWFLSGQMAPIALLPWPLPDIAAALPFRWTVAFPVEVALGRPEHGEALAGLVAQAGWLLAALVVLGATWRAGLRRYTAVGA